jgi:thiol-disulfide isomerase/thioredoxin
MKFTDGIIVVVKKDCPTCLLIAPVLEELEQSGKEVSVYYQDTSDFLSVTNVIDDRELEVSYRLNIEIVPTLLMFSGGKESSRLTGWEREEWRSCLELESLGEDLPDWRPGCGSRSVEPEIIDVLEAKFGNFDFSARKIPLPLLADDIEYCFENGWTDGLPVVPPTQERVLRMLKGTSRAPNEVLGVLPPYSIQCTVSKVAINAVLAGCKPEYFPVVLAAVEAALEPAFCLHGLLDESTSWTTLSEERGLDRGVSAVTLFSADGPIGCVDQKSREPEGLIYSLAGTLKGINHIDMANGSDAVVIIGPEHGRVFDNAGWSKERTVDALQSALLIRGENLRAGGQAGLFSAIIPGWIMKGAPGTDPITKEIKL